MKTYYRTNPIKGSKLAMNNSRATKQLSGILNKQGLGKVEIMGKTLDTLERDFKTHASLLEDYSKLNKLKGILIKSTDRKPGLGNLREDLARAGGYALGGVLYSPAVAGTIAAIDLTRKMLKSEKGRLVRANISDALKARDTEKLDQIAASLGLDRTKLITVMASLKDEE